MSINTTLSILSRCFGKGNPPKLVYDRQYYTDRIEPWACSQDYESRLMNLANLMEIKQGDRLLDIGCGTGRAIKFLGSEFGAICDGVEISEQAIEAAVKNGVHPTAYNGTEIDFYGSQFDHAILIEVIGHIEDSEAVISEAYRVVKTGGKIGITTPNRNYMIAMTPKNLFNDYKNDKSVVEYFSARSLSKLLTKCGFTVERVEWQYF